MCVSPFFSFFFCLDVSVHEGVLPVAVRDLHLLQLAPQLLSLLLLLLLALSLRLVVGSEFVEQFPIHLHEGLEDVVDEGHDRLVPMILGNLVQRREHDRHHHARVLFDHRHDVLVVPKIESALGAL